MATIDRIRHNIRRGEYEFAVPHFFQEMANDNLSFEDIEHAILFGQIERRLTDDPRGVRYEIVGESMDGRPVGLVCRIKETGALLLITCYVLG